MKIINYMTIVLGALVIVLLADGAFKWLDGTVGINPWLAGALGAFTAGCMAYAWELSKEKWR